MSATISVHANGSRRNTVLFYFVINICAKYRSHVLDGLRDAFFYL